MLVAAQLQAAPRAAQAADEQAQAHACCSNEAPAEAEVTAVAAPSMHLPTDCSNNCPDDVPCDCGCCAHAVPCSPIAAAGASLILIHTDVSAHFPPMAERCPAPQALGVPLRPPIL